MHMMMAFGFCMYCLWKNRNYLLPTFNTTLSTHTQHLHILMISSLVLAAIPVVTVCGYTQSRDLIVQSHDDSESQGTAYYYAEENSLLSHIIPTSTQKNYHIPL